MRSYTIVIERDAEAGGFVGHVPGWPGAHSQGDTIAELQEHMSEVIAMLLEDGEPVLESEFVVTLSVSAGVLLRQSARDIGVSVETLVRAS